MKPIVRAVPFLVLVFATALSLCRRWAKNKTKPPATYPELPSEIPAKFKPANDSFDYTRRKVMIPMRDGVKLHTVILIPKGAKRAPILLTRTPYSADKLTSHAESAHLGPVLHGYDNAVDVILEGGYIRVVQDVRGKHGSEGDYIVNRPLRGPQNPTPVDHATDTWDTIDWLVKNVPESNGKVGILGISYNGFLPLMALVDPHPALKVSVPMNPMVDGWIGDDWFHYGAFRQINVSWIYNQVATRKGDAKWWRSHHDEYDMWMQAGSAGELGRRRGLDQLGFWNKLVEHPAYDAFWRDQAVDKLLADAAAENARDAGPQLVGPGRHLRRTRRLQGDRAEGHGERQGLSGHRPVASRPDDRQRQLAGRREIRQRHRALLPPEDPRSVSRPVSERRRPEGRHRPRHRVRDGHERLAPLFGLAAESRRRQSRQSDAALSPRRSETEPGGPEARRCCLRGVHLRSRQTGPLRPRPIKPMGYEEGNPWPRWLVDDQREASGRPDVVTFISDTLTAPMKISGEPIANLVASTSGTDSDWVVKLIDVYPDEVGERRRHGRLPAHDRRRHFPRPLP